MPEGKIVEISPAKGQPMFTWVGKRPLHHVAAFPAKLIEIFDPLRSSVRNPQSKIGKGGLLFHGDNKDVLAHLLDNGFRGKVDLIYIDPPFGSGAEYVRNVTLRGATNMAKLDGSGYTLGEEIQYADIWTNDSYLQFMYERLLLLRELLAEDGIIVLHCDYRQVGHLRLLMDEIFSAERFVNEIVWGYRTGGISREKGFPRKHDNLLVYSAGEHFTYNPAKETIYYDKPFFTNSQPDATGRYPVEVYVRDVWDDELKPVLNVSSERLDYQTQKPESLLRRIIAAFSNPGDLVLDCFIGSGTTAAVAQKMGRRWIGCDINKDAIQTTSKRLQAIILEQAKALPLRGEGWSGGEPVPCQLSFAVYRVNDYDLQIQHDEAVNLVCEHIGITPTKSDAFFDGTLGKKLVKIIPFSHPLTLLDLEEVKRELAARPEEERSVVVICLGKETMVAGWLEEWNRLRKKGDVLNKIEIIELRSDPKYGKFFAHQPAKARVTIKRVRAKRASPKIQVKITDFISPTIIERLKQQASILPPHIDDWRVMVDSVMIDAAYDGSVFNIVLADLPEKKTDLVAGKYELDAPAGETIVAVKITDMLGEEVLVTRRV